MLTFLGDVALNSEHMGSKYKPEYPYVFNLEYVCSCNKDNLVPVIGKINLFSPNNQFDEVFGKNPIAVNIVNNHIYDFGDIGFERTVSTMTKKGILCITDEPIILNDKVCLMSFMKLSNNLYFQFEFTTVQEKILKIKNKNPDIRIVVQIHWGIENHPCETEEQRFIAHWLIDNGVDLIIGHHPHCMQSVEEYKGKTIFYSLGNALFGNICTPSHYNENLESERIYRFKWQSWNRESLAVVYDEDKNQINRIDLLYQKENTLLCMKENVSVKSLCRKNEKLSKWIYKYRKYFLFVASNIFVNGKLFDLDAIKHELRRCL